MELTNKTPDPSPAAILAFEPYVTIKGLRQYLSADTGLPGLGLAISPWTRQELAQAIVSAARTYNSIPPLLSGGCNPSTLPTNTNMFFDGAAAQAYQLLLMKLQRRDVTVQAGGVTTNPVERQIKHAQEMFKQFDQSFREAARVVKLTINHCGGYGRVG